MGRKNLMAACLAMSLVFASMPAYAEENEILYEGETEITYEEETEDFETEEADIEDETETDLEEPETEEEEDLETEEIPDETEVGLEENYYLAAISDEPEEETNGIVIISETASESENVESIDISGKVWLDVNENGINEPTEPGIEGISVSLLRTTVSSFGSGDDAVTSFNGTPMYEAYLADGTQASMAVTGEDGSYEITGLEEGTYYILFPQLADYSYSITNGCSGVYDDSDLISAYISNISATTNSANLGLVASGLVIIETVDEYSEKIGPMCLLLSGMEYVITDGSGNYLEFSNGTYTGTSASLSGASVLVSDGNGMIYLYGIPGGTYTISQASAYEGYLQMEDQEVVIDTSEGTVTITLDHDLPYGILTVEATGEIATSFDGSAFTYTETGLSGITYAVYADEDIYPHNFSVKYEKDEQVAKAVTDEDGVASFKTELPIGKYYVEATSVVDGYEAEESRIYFEVTSSDEIVYITENFKYERVTTILSFSVIEEDGTTPVANAVFGLYTADSLISGLVTLPADTLLATATTNTDGSGTFDIDVPSNGEYYIKLISAPSGYIISTEEYMIDLSNAGNTLNISFKCTYTKTVFSLADGENAVSGIEIELYNSDGDLVVSWVTDGADYEIDYLAEGTYTLSVKSVPEGYAIPEDYTFTLTLTDETQNISLILEKKETETEEIETETEKTETEITENEKVETNFETEELETTEPETKYSETAKTETPELKESETGATEVEEPETGDGNETEEVDDTELILENETEESTEKQSETLDSSTESEIETEAETENKSETEIETESETEIETENETETEIETESKSETETETESETEIETESEIVTEPESETETKTEKQSEISESETESETESEKAAAETGDTMNTSGYALLMFIAVFVFLLSASRKERF